jgi:engulfment/cell motility protein 1
MSVMVSGVNGLNTNPLLSAPTTNSMMINNTSLSTTGVSGTSSTGGSTGKRWRYYKLSRSKRAIMYGDFSEKIAPVLKSYEKLPNRIDLSSVHEIRPIQKPASTNASTGLPLTMESSMNNHLSFALYTDKNIAIAEFYCATATQASEWKDGFSMLLDKRFTSKETAEIFHTLTEVGVKVKLLQIAGDRVEIPHGVVEVPPVPPGLGYGFFYDSIES